MFTFLAHPVSLLRNRWWGSDAQIGICTADVLLLQPVRASNFLRYPLVFNTSHLMWFFRTALTTLREIFSPPRGSIVGKGGVEKCCPECYRELSRRV